MIAPTIGRVVWYFPVESDLAVSTGRLMERYDDKPFLAHVCYVWSDTCVNLVVFDHAGQRFTRTSVAINVDGASPHAEWMPYQKAVAAATIPANIHAQPTAA